MLEKSLQNTIPLFNSKNNFYFQVLKVAILAEKYATDYKWYVDVILNLIRLAGDYVSEEVKDILKIAKKKKFYLKKFNYLNFFLRSGIALFKLSSIVRMSKATRPRRFLRPCKPPPVTKIWSKLVVCIIIIYKYFCAMYQNYV